MSLEFKSATLYAVRLVLQSADTAELLAELDRRMQDAGSFFQQEPVVIDASAVEDAIDWPALIDALRRHQLPAIGVVAQGANLDDALAAGLAAVELSNPVVRPAAAPAPDHEVPPPAAAAAVTAAPAAPAGAAEAPTQPATPEVAPAALVVRRQLRSGQRIYARNTDLIIIGVVGQGAEVIADGNIHVYGPLRGKAMAGARGDDSARIFASQLDPELLAIAGIYRVVETRLDPALHNKPCVVQLQDDKLEIQALDR